MCGWTGQQLWATEAVRKVKRDDVSVALSFEDFDLFNGQVTQPWRGAMPVDDGDSSCLYSSFLFLGLLGHVK